MNALLLTVSTPKPESCPEVPLDLGADTPERAAK